MGGNGVVHHGGSNKSIVLLSTSRYESTIKMLGLTFESSTTKTVGGDRYLVFTIYMTGLGGNGEVHHGDHNNSFVIKSTIHEYVTI